MKKTLTIILAFVLVIAMSVAGTVAYLTDTTEEVKNTFTVGSIAITMDEAKTNEYGVVDAAATARVTENTYKLIPGHEYAKDPKIHVELGSEECWLFVKVTNEIADIEADTKIAAQMTAKNWTLVDETNGVWAYNTKVDARTEAKDIPVFETFTIAGSANVASFNEKTITLVACAVQADGLTQTEALAEASFAA